MTSEQKKHLSEFHSLGVTHNRLIRNNSENIQTAPVPMGSYGILWVPMGSYGFRAKTITVSGLSVCEGCKSASERNA